MVLRRKWTSHHQRRRKSRNLSRQYTIHRSFSKKKSFFQSFLPKFNVSAFWRRCLNALFFSCHYVLLGREQTPVVVYGLDLAWMCAELWNQSFVNQFFYGCQNRSKGWHWAHSCCEWKNIQVKSRYNELLGTGKKFRYIEIFVKSRLKEKWISTHILRLNNGSNSINSEDDPKYNIPGKKHYCTSRNRCDGAAQ